MPITLADQPHIPIFQLSDFIACLDDSARVLKVYEAGDGIFCGFTSVYQTSGHKNGLLLLP
jgi:hypothetical protein